MSAVVCRGMEQLMAANSPESLKQICTTGPPRKTTAAAAAAAAVLDCSSLLAETDIAAGRAATLA